MRSVLKACALASFNWCLKSFTLLFSSFNKFWYYFRSIMIFAIFCCIWVPFRIILSNPSVILSNCHSRFIGSNTLVPSICLRMDAMWSAIVCRQAKIPAIGSIFPNVSILSSVKSFMRDLSFSTASSSWMILSSWMTNASSFSSKWSLQFVSSAFIFSISYLRDTRFFSRYLIYSSHHSKSSISLRIFPLFLIVEVSSYTNFIRNSRLLSSKSRYACSTPSFFFTNHYIFSERIEKRFL